MAKERPTDPSSADAHRNTAENIQLAESPGPTETAPSAATCLDSPERLKAIQETELLSSMAPLALQLLCELVNERIGTPASLVTLVTDNLQFFAGSNGLCEPWNSRRSTPLTHSFCQHVVTRNEPLVINDARSHSLVAENLAIPDLDVAAYLGVPLVSSDGMILGSICAIDNRPRTWSEENLDVLKEMAKHAMEEIAEQRRLSIERRKIQDDLQQARRMEAIGTLSSAIAHDFNNILMVYQSFSDLIQLNADNREDVLRYAKILEETTHQAKAVVDQLVGWTQKNQSDKKETINLSHSLRHAVPLIRALIPTSISLEVVIPPEEVFIEATPNEVTEILLNLASNAEHAMRQNGGTLTVELKPSSSTQHGNHSGLLLRITDTGCGIPDDDLHQVYSPFFTRKGEKQHSGLGLSTVYQSVTKMGGRMDIQSIENAGTTVMIELPPSEPAKQEEHKDAVVLAKAGQKILCVDDEPMIANGLAIQLQRLGYQTVSQTSSRDAHALFACDPDQFALVVTDQTMPEMSGQELVASIREIRPDLPAIILTSLASETEAPASVRCVGKPISVVELSRVVDEVLHGCDVTA